MLNFCYNMLLFHSVCSDILKDQKQRAQCRLGLLQIIFAHVIMQRNGYAREEKLKCQFALFGPNMLLVSSINVLKTYVHPFVSLANSHQSTLQLQPVHTQNRVIYLCVCKCAVLFSNFNTFCIVFIY